MARWGGWALLLVLVWTQTGCLWTDESAPNNWLARLQKQTITPDHALIEVALIERPSGDEYINKRIWEQVDEMIVDLARASALKQNGLRVGQLVGPTPDDFQKLLLSKRCCANPHAMIFPSGRKATIYLGPELPQSTYELVEGNLRSEITLDQARYGLELSAQFDSAGRTKLSFLPKIENGEIELPFEAVPERAAWQLRIDKASRKYPALSWEVTLSPNQYLLIGCQVERAKTIGWNAFTQSPGTANVQRLLIIRSCRPVTAKEASQNNMEELIRSDPSAPLALQATIPAARAKSN